MTTWYTSDGHLGQRKILIYEPGRPGKGPTIEAAIEEHDEILIDRHNSVVDPDDEVWVLGDVAMGDITRSLAKCARMNGRKILVCGNHDRPSMTSDPAKQAAWIDRYRTEGGFFCVIPGGLYTTVELPGGRVVQVSHYPYAGDSQDADRYQDRRPVDDGSWLLHGHVHSKWQVNGRMINVGVDVWDYRPVPAERIEQLIRSR
jgi:calcineurin-like phosphoesterase family protein